MQVGKYSLEIAERFSHKGVSRLQAIMKANQVGVDLSPLWISQI
jgi:hypothetical protein